MATIRAYTTIEQSRKLAEILPLESADMYWFRDDTETPKIYPKDMMKDSISVTLPCWSLAALLDVLPYGTDIIKDEADTENEKYMCTVGIKDDIICMFGNNPVDACVAMIEKLNGLKKL